MKTKLFLDTNVMLDLLGNRIPFYNSIARIATFADEGQIKLVVSAFSYSTVFYILSKYEGAEIVKEKLRKFRIISEVANLNDKSIDKGLVSDFSDFEDALQYHCALKSNCEIIITRDMKGFKKSMIPVLSANEYLQSLKKH